jgi:transposase
MHTLRKKNERLTKKDKKVMDKLFSHSPDLKEAYRLGIKLTHIFNTQMSKAEALVKINAWIRRVKRSHLTCFNSFVIILKKYKNMIANYFIDRNTSGFVEGLNNKVKVLKRRCYGIFNLKYLFQRLHLDISRCQLLLGKSAG